MVVQKNYYIFFLSCIFRNVCEVFLKHLGLEMIEDKQKYAHDIIVHEHGAVELMGLKPNP